MGRSAHLIHRAADPGLDRRLRDHRWGVYPVQMLDGIGAGLQSVAVPALVARILNGTGRVNVGQGAVMTMQGIGASLSPAIGGWIAQEIGYSAVFTILGGFALGSVALWVGFAPISSRPAQDHRIERFSCRARGTGRMMQSGDQILQLTRLIVSDFRTIDMSPHVMTGYRGTRHGGRHHAPFQSARGDLGGGGRRAAGRAGVDFAPDALTGVAKGTDVYLFLFGMMLLAEIAREEGLFDWLAAVATSHANGSARRLFLLIYGVGTIVTVFLSNDATAVVLTPAVAAAVKTAKAKEPLPYLLICAFIANAASFVLPISNPANLVIYGSHMPPLLHWLPAYVLPSVVSIAATYLVLRWTQRGALRSADRQGCAGADPCPAPARPPPLGIAATAVVLLASSAFDLRLGLPTAIAGDVTAAGRADPRARRARGAREGYFLGRAAARRRAFRFGRGADQTGVTGMITALLHEGRSVLAIWAAWSAGIMSPSPAISSTICRPA